MPAQKTVLSFGLVAIPVALHPAVQENDVGFHQLHRDDQRRIRYKKVCEGCGKEVKQGDIVKGYEFEKDRHVVVTDEELEGIKTEKEKAVEILRFVAPGEISAVSCARAWYALPEPGGEKAFELLRRALIDENRTAVGKTVLGAKESLMAVLPHEDGLAVQSLYFADEIKEPPQPRAQPKVTAQEIGMARKLVQAMAGAFDPGEVRDEYQDRLKKLLESKISGEAFAAPVKSGQVSVADLMEAFRQSIEQAGPGGGKAAKKGAGKKGGKGK